MAALVGRFVVTLRPDDDELDEFLVGAQIPAHKEAVVFTTSDIPLHRFEMRMLELRPGVLEQGGVTLVVGLNGARRLPLHLRGMA